MSLLYPERNRGRTRKGIKFWIERFIINLAGELSFQGTGFQEGRGHPADPGRASSGGGAERGMGRVSHWKEMSGPPEAGLGVKDMPLI